MCRPIFDLQERINLLRKITAKDAEKIEVRQVEGLLVDFCEDNDIDFMVSSDSDTDYGLIIQSVC
jgi:phosphopantetheine adenylyltransferase